MQKRGQITIFVIIGIVVVLGIIGFVVMNNSGSSSNDNINSPEISSAVNFIESCIEDTAKEGILEVAKYGGKFPTAQDKTILEVRYYYLDNKDLMPEKKVFANSLSAYVSQNIDECLNGYQSLTEYRIISEGNSFESIIDENKTLVFFVSKHTIEKDGKTYQVDEFEYSLDTKLGLLYDSARYLVENQAKNPGSTCLSCLIELSIVDNLQVITTEIEDGTTIYSIASTQETINNEPLVLLFAFKSIGAPSNEE